MNKIDFSLDLDKEFTEQNFPREGRETLYNEIAHFFVFAGENLDRAEQGGMDPMRVQVAVPLHLSVAMAFLCLYFAKRFDAFDSNAAYQEAILDTSTMSTDKKRAH